jgi:beta-lactam-binding protein with PASTA domain
MHGIQPIPLRVVWYSSRGERRPAMTDMENPVPTVPGTDLEGGPDRKALWIVLIAMAVFLLLVLIWRASGGIAVPGVVGLAEADAVLQLETSGLVAGTVSEEPTLGVEPGIVVSQDPGPDAEVPEGSSVDLAVSAIPVTEVPDVVGSESSEAKAELAEAGLVAGEITGSYSDDVEAGVVLSQLPEAGMEVEVASTVVLEVSLGSATNAVPDVVGLTSTDAVEVIEAAGFAANQRKSTSDTVEAGTVFDQSPAAGTLAEAGTTVQLTVSTGPPAGPAAPQPEAEPEPEPAPEPEPERPEPPAPEPEVATVPDLIGMRVLESVRALRQADLGFQVTWGPTPDNYLRVIAQDPGAGTETDPGTVVTITIGLPQFLFDGVEVQPLPTEPGDTQGSETATTSP